MGQRCVGILVVWAARVNGILGTRHVEAGGSGGLAGPNMVIGLRRGYNINVLLPLRRWW